MHRLIAHIGLAAVVIASASAAAQSPEFEPYRAVVSTERPAEVRLSSHPQAKTYPTILRAAAQNGPNFAGHFTLVTWGCGTNCIVVAIIDAHDGRVYFPFNREGVSTPYKAQSEVATFEYRPDSRLLIVAGGLPSHEKLGIAHLLWDGRKFKELSFEAKSEWQ